MVGSIRVLIADDHAPTRRQIRAALERHGFTVCAEVASGDSAVAAALKEHPQVCLLDVSMPTSGIVAAQQISEALPWTTIIMLTASSDADDLFSALRAGASGYLVKGADHSRLGSTLEGTLRGEAALSRTLTRKVIAEFHRRERERNPLLRRRGRRLTAKEWEVLQLMGEGLTTREMADRLFVAPVTVRTHVSAILRKLRVKSRAELLELLAR